MIGVVNRRQDYILDKSGSLGAVCHKGHQKGGAS